MNNNNIYYNDLCHINNIKVAIESSINSNNYSNYPNSKWGWNDPKRRKINKMYHIVITNLTNNRVNVIVNNVLKFDCSYIISHDHIKYP